MISIADQKRISTTRLLRSYAQLRGRESGTKTVVRAGAWVVSCFVEAAILYAVAKVLFFHNLPVW